jgi:hypothetical protein
MNVKKFLLVALIFGLTRLCHAAPQADLISSPYALPQAPKSSVAVYPCITCTRSWLSSIGSVSQDLQAGIGVRVLF